MQNKLLLVTGADSQIGKEYQLSQEKEGWDFIFLTKKELDITNESSVFKAFDSLKPDACLNLAAYTSIKKAEVSELKAAYAVNVHGAQNIAIVCNHFKIPVIHISSEYVFDGKTPMVNEEDIPRPISYYGKTKLLGEVAIETYCSWHYILRTSWLYSNHSKNLYTESLNLAQERSRISVSESIMGCPTSVKELCRAIDAVLDNLSKSLSGLYHFSGRGRVTEKAFVEELFSLSRIAVIVSPEAASAKNPLKPANVVLDTTKFSNAFGYVSMHWKNALIEVLAERKIIPIKVGDLVIFEGDSRIVVSTDWIKKVARIARINNMKESIEVEFKHLELHGN